VVRQRVGIGMNPASTTPEQRFSDYLALDAKRAKAFHLLKSVNESAWLLERWALPSCEVELQAKIRLGTDSERITSKEISTDGRYLYLYFSTGRLIRLTTNDLKIDLEIANAGKVARPSSGFLTPLRVKPLADEPEAFVYSTESGELIVQTGTAVRVFDSSLFPRQGARQIYPVLASRDFVYAVESRGGPCLVRFKIDELGLFPPREYCDLGNEWGDQPEMLRFPGRMVLHHGEQSISLLPSTNRGYFPQLESSALIDLASGVVAMVMSQGFRPPENSLRVDLSDLRTGKATGHFPKLGTMLPFAEVFFFGDLMITQTSSAIIEPSKAVIFRNYKENVEWYPDSQP